MTSEGTSGYFGDYTNKALRPESTPETTTNVYVSETDWQSLYHAARHEADVLAGLLARRHSLDPVEVYEVLRMLHAKDND